jgi:hypothetical protein
MSQQPVRRTIKVRRPSIVSDVIDVGLHGCIGLLRDDPSRVIKFCNPKNEDAVNALEQEKRILSILGPHPYITHLHWVSEKALCFEYYPLSSLRSYYETLQPRLPDLCERIRWCHQTVDAVAYIKGPSSPGNPVGSITASISDVRNDLLTSTIDEVERRLE